MKQAGMAPALRRGTLGNLAGHQRGEAADPMESWSPGRRARQPCRLPWNRTSPPVRSRNFVRSSGGTGSAVSGRLPRRCRRRLPGRPRRAAAVASESAGSHAGACVIQPDSRGSASRDRGRPYRVSSLNLDRFVGIERLSGTQGWTVNEIPSTPDPRTVNETTSALCVRGNSGYAGGQPQLPAVGRETTREAKKRSRSE